MSIEEEPFGAEGAACEELERAVHDACEGITRAIEAGALDVLGRSALERALISAQELLDLLGGPPLG